MGRHTAASVRHTAAPGAGTSRSTGIFTGTRTLLTVALHQDRTKIAPWVGLISVLSATSILAYRWIFPELVDRKTLAMAIGANPAMQLVFGPPRDLLTNDGFNAWRAGALGAFFAGLMAIIIVVRNTRADEDSGRAELIASGVITRETRLLVAVLMATVAAVALAVVCFLLTWVSGGEARPTAVLSLTFAASALMYAGVAAVAAQLGSDARTASSIAIAILGVSYVARGYLDSTGADEWTRWLTPLGWLEQTYPATQNSLWPLIPAVLLAIALVALALVLQRRRDFGLGLIPARPGPATAPGLRLRGLAVQVHRGSVITWMIGLAFLGLVYGNLVTSVGDVFASNPAMGAIIASGAATPEGLSFGFVATVLHLVGIVTAIMGAQILMRVYAEETDDRVEPVLATATSRPAYLGSNVLIAVASTALGMLAAGTVMGVVAATSDAGIGFGDVVRQAIVTIPAVWVLVGVSVATVGAEPSRRIAGWLVIVATFGITLLGPTFKLPDWMLGISPLYHVPNVQAASPAWVSLAGLGAVACVLYAVGFAGFRRRDIH